MKLFKSILESSRNRTRKLLRKLAWIVQFWVYFRTPIRIGSATLVITVLM